MSSPPDLAPVLSEKEALVSGYEALTSPISTNAVALWGDGTVKGDMLSLFLADHPGRAVLVRCREPDYFEVWVRPLTRKLRPQGSPPNAAWTG